MYKCKSTFSLDKLVAKLGSFPGQVEQSIYHNTTIYNQSIMKCQKGNGMWQCVVLSSLNGCLVCNEWISSLKRLNDNYVNTSLALLRTISSTQNVCLKMKKDPEPRPTTSLWLKYKPRYVNSLTGYVTLPTWYICRIVYVFSYMIVFSRCSAILNKHQPK